MSSGLSPSVNTWINWHSLALALAIPTSVVAAAPLLPGLVALVSFAIFAAAHRTSLATQWPQARLANWLTTTRLLLVMSVALAGRSMPVLLVFLLFLGNLALDVADGFAARRLGRTSRFGAAFDQETDAFFVLVAGLYFHQAAAFGPWVLVPGLLRYFYRLVLWSCGGDRIQERRRPLLATLAGVNFCLVTVAVVLPAAARFSVLALACGLVTLSFGISFSDLFGNRHGRSSAE